MGAQGNTGAPGLSVVLSNTCGFLQLLQASRPVAAGTPLRGLPVGGWVLPWPLRRVPAAEISLVIPPFAFYPRRSLFVAPVSLVSWRRLLVPRAAPLIVPVIMVPVVPVVPMVSRLVPAVPSLSLGPLAPGLGSWVSRLAGVQGSRICPGPDTCGGRARGERATDLGATVGCRRNGAPTDPPCQCLASEHKTHVQHLAHLLLLRLLHLEQLLPPLVRSERIVIPLPLFAVPVDIFVLGPPATWCCYRVSEVVIVVLAVLPDGIP